MFSGPCHGFCDRCFGPTAADCFKCIDGAGRTEGGYCECLPGRYPTDASEDYPC